VVTCKFVNLRQLWVIGGTIPVGCWPPEKRRCLLFL